MKKRVLFAWSSGKDSALALHELKKNPDVEVAALLTTVTEGYDRISMHGVRRNLLSLQAEALGYPLDEVVIPQNCTNEIYEQRMNEAVRKYKDAGVETAAFGDIFLQDVREYREERMNRAGMSCIFLSGDARRRSFRRSSATRDSKPSWSASIPTRLLPNSLDAGTTDRLSAIFRDRSVRRKR